jgi:hypothetical protein
MTETITIANHSAVLSVDYEHGLYVVTFADGSTQSEVTEDRARRVALYNLNNWAGEDELRETDPRLTNRDQHRERAAAYFRAAAIQTRRLAQ